MRSTLYFRRTDPPRDKTKRKHNPWFCISPIYVYEPILSVSLFTQEKKDSKQTKNSKFEKKLNSTLKIVISDPKFLFLRALHADTKNHRVVHS